MPEVLRALAFSDKCNKQGFKLLPSKGDSPLGPRVPGQGFCDAIRIHQAGYPHVVALMGSSITLDAKSSEL
jgi:hypothetical protein